jgi:hypothetical protein
LLLDKHFALDLIKEVKRYDAAIDIIRVGQADAPPF